MLRDLNQTYPGGLRRVGLCTTGVAGGTVPSTGTHGPAWMYPSLELPADAAVEVAYWIESHNFPAGQLPLDDTSAGAFAGLPDGIYSAAVRLERWGVDVGSFPAVVKVGVDPGYPDPQALVLYSNRDNSLVVLVQPLPAVGGQLADMAG